MVSRRDTGQVRDELVAAVKQGDEARARTLVFQLGDGPKQVRAVLEARLEDVQGLVRQAAAFGLGELGGAASVRRLEQQLTVEEARGDYDGEAVVEDIVRALSTDGFQECKRETTTSRRDSRPAGGLWQGINIRTGAVASAIWVNRLLSRQAMVFITVDGELLQGEVADFGPDPYREDGGEG